MPRKKLSMRKIREVARLRASGLSIRQIARSCNIARSTTSDYLDRLEKAGLGWPLPAELEPLATPTDEVASSPSLEPAIAGAAVVVRAIPMALLGIYLLGVLFMSGRLAAGIVQAQRLWSQSSPARFAAIFPRTATGTCRERGRGNGTRTGKE